MIYLLVTLTGVVAGLRAMLVPAMVSWAAFLGIVHLEGTWLAFFSAVWAPWVFSALALAELVGDQLPSTPNRTVPVQFVTRLISGSIGGIALTIDSHLGTVGGILGALGALFGTFGGLGLRRSLAERFGRDQPAAFIEDGVALLTGFFIVMGLS